MTTPKTPKSLESWVDALQSRGRNLHDKQSDAAFMSDIAPLLRPGAAYDAAQAMALVRESLIELLPGDPWRGPSAGRRKR